MDRKEFCELMAKAKKESGIRSIDISRHFQMAMGHLYRFEKGASSFSMVQAISYLDFLGFQIVLSKSDEQIKINNYFVFPPLVKKWRGAATKSSLARSIGVTDTAIHVLEKEISVAGIDTFLKLINHFDYKLTIESAKNSLFSNSYTVDENWFYQTVSDAKSSLVTEGKVRRSPSEKRVIEIVENRKQDVSLTILARYLQLFKHQICLSSHNGSWLFSDSEGLIKWLSDRVSKAPISYISTKIDVTTQDLWALDGRRKDMNASVFLKLIGCLGLSISVEKIKEND